MFALSLLVDVTAIMPGLLDQLDGAISELLAGWNVYSTLLSFGILGFLTWVIYDTADADTHPLLLARQAQASYVRQPGESAIFRSPETPHGCMLVPHSLTVLQLMMARLPPNRLSRATCWHSLVLCRQRWRS